MDPAHDEPPAYDDLDHHRRPRWVHDDQAVIRAIRRILEQAGVPLEQRRALAQGFFDDLVFTEAEAFDRWLNRCRERAHEPGDGQPPVAPTATS